MLPVLPPALLALADGTVFHGISIGAAGRTVGEVVFNTALTGYQEILTDPSYCRQIVTLTYPHIGNYGVNDEDVEAAQGHAAGLVIKDLPLRGLELPQHARRSASTCSARARSAIAGIDTRRLTRAAAHAAARRTAASSAFAAGTAIDAGAIADEAVAARARGAEHGRARPGQGGRRSREPYEWTETEWALGSGYGAQTAPRCHVVAYDYGVKRNILRMLAERGCRVTVVPAQTPAADVLELKPDGVFLANGPGDPEPCDYAIEATRELIERGIPTFGICLGHQIMALASRRARPSR